MFQQRDVDDPMARISELLKNYEKRKELGQRGREKTINLHSYQVIAETILWNLQEALGGKDAWSTRIC